MKEYKLQNPEPKLQPTLTLAEAKEHMFGTPYTRELQQAPTLKEGDYGDLVTIQTSPAKRERNLKKAAPLIRKFHKDPSSIGLLTAKEMRHGLRLLGVLPTATTKGGLIVQLSRALSNPQISGGILSIDVEQDRLSQTSPTHTPPGAISLEDAIQKQIAGLEPPPKPKAIQLLSKTSPRTVVMGMTEKEIVITNCSHQSTINMSKSELIASFRARRDADARTSGHWSKEEGATRSFFFPEGCTLPPRCEIHILCGLAGKKYLGNNSDMPGRVQRMCWDPERDWFPKIQMIALMDPTGKRMQWTSRRVLLERCRSVRRALHSIKDDKKESKKDSALYKVMKELDTELRLASGLDTDTYDLPHPKPDYEHQVNGLYSAIAKQKQLQTNNSTLKSLSQQGVMPEAKRPSPKSSRYTFFLDGH
eukprot:TRINITY_DN18934_c0_g1_i1.p1 TRINITY_DN18934_c0_g1~~TRINITY_DN18934_c0_g1_i1.p1  ORF type:complete len:469 (+),score=77.37 TRINITY_DN18934_c0_g1_i1:153-1409(+)